MCTHILVYMIGAVHTPLAQRDADALVCAKRSYLDLYLGAHTHTHMNIYISRGVHYSLAREHADIQTMPPFKHT